MATLWLVEPAGAVIDGTTVVPFREYKSETGDHCRNFPCALLFALKGTLVQSATGAGHEFLAYSRRRSYCSACRGTRRDLLG